MHKLRARISSAPIAATFLMRPRRAQRLLTIALAIGLGGCATYQAKPLPTRPDLVSDVGRVTVNAAKLSLPELRSHRFDAADGLDMTEVAMLGVVNNPELRAARAKVGVAQAQAFAAGLLPDPQVSATRDVPRESDPTLTSAYSVGLAYDLNALVTRGAGHKAATAATRQTDLDLLWQEWQVVARARSLFVAITTDRQLLGLLRRQRRLYEGRYDRAQRALESGNLSADEAAVYLAALQDVDKQVNDRERQLADRRHDLDALLGLAPTVPLDLVGTPSLPPLNEVQIGRALAELPRRRPDLLALQAGYEAQEQRVREAILAQFPAFNLALSQARDTSDIHTRGLAVTLTLPLLNGNRGAIAVERATRAQLYAEYQTRLDTADSDARRLLANQKLLAAQQLELTRNLTRLQRVSAAAERAYREGDMDALKYVDLETASINARMEAVSLNALMWQQRIGLLTLLGGDLSVSRKGAKS